MIKRKSQMHLITPSLDSNRSVNSCTLNSLSRGTRSRSEFRILQLSTGARACLRKTVEQLVRINGLNAPFWNILRVYTVYTLDFLCNIRAKTEQMSNNQSIWRSAINGRFTRIWCQGYAFPSSSAMRFRPPIQCLP